MRTPSKNETIIAVVASVVGYIVSFLMPTSEVLPTPEQWFVTRDRVVIDSPDVVAVAKNLEPGNYQVFGYPKEGKITEFAITITDKLQPVEPTPPKPDEPKPEPPKPPVTTKATTATYVYEKDDTALIPAVLSGLNRLNREKKIIATLYEDDNTNGKNAIPEQYKLAYDAAKKAGLPVLIITDGTNVLNVVKAPTTEQQVWEAVK